MKVVDFPLSKFILCFIAGIFIGHCLNFDFTLLLYSQILLTFLLFLSYYVNFKSSSSKYIFGLLLLFSALSLGVFTQFFHNQSSSITHYTKKSEAYDRPHTISLTIREKLKSSTKSTRYIAIINSIDRQTFHGKIIVQIKNPKKTTHLEVGNKIYVKEKLSPIAKPSNPNQFDYADYLKNKNIFAQISVNENEILFLGTLKKDIWFYTSRLRSKIINEFKEKGLKNNELHVAIALLLGQRQDLNPDLTKDYQFAGATHLLAVSGLHVGFVMLFLNFFLNKISPSRRNNLTKLIIVLLTLAFYAILTGLSPSILRATIMFSFIAAADYMRRPTNTIHTLLVSAFFILLFDSNSLFDVGFQLSYSAVFFIVWMQPVFKQLKRPKNVILKQAWDIFFVSLAAQLGTLPLTLYYFHQFPGLFFVTNLIVIPLVSLIMFVGLLALVAASLGLLPTFIILLLHYLIWGLNAFVSWIASFRQFIFQDISFSASTALCTFLLIICIITIVKRNTYQNTVVLLSAIVLTQTVVIYQKIGNLRKSELIVYNNKNATLLSIKNGDVINYYSDSIVNLKSRAAKDYLIYNDGILKNNKIVNFLTFNTTKLMIVDSSQLYLKNPRPDVLLIRQCPKINLERLIQEIHPKIIIADATNHKFAIEQWKKTCKIKKIPFHNTYEMGYYKHY